MPCILLWLLLPPSSQSEFTCSSLSSMKESTGSFLVSPGKLPCSTGPSFLSRPGLLFHALITGLGCLPCAGMRANPSGNGNNRKPPRLDDLSPYITITQTLNNISNHSLIAYIHELTHPRSDLWAKCYSFYCWKVGEQRYRVTCLSSNPDVWLQSPHY